MFFRIAIIFTIIQLNASAYQDYDISLKDLKQHYSELIGNLTELISTIDTNLPEHQRIKMQKSLKTLETKLYAIPIETQDPVQICKQHCTWIDGTTINEHPQDCGEAVGNGGKSGIYRIDPTGQNNWLEVYCLKNDDEIIDGNDRSAWWLIQPRQTGNVDFYRNYETYESLIGNLKSEFFYGLYWLNQLTSATKHELWIQLEDWDGAKRFAKYSDFRIGTKDEGYVLESLGTYYGNAGDSLSGHLDRKWTARDRDNDKNTSNCAIKHHGAWWYANTKSGSMCADSNLLGKYLVGVTPPESQGIYWLTWRGHDYSYKYVHMAIRPVKLSEGI